MGKNIILDNSDLFIDFAQVSELLQDGSFDEADKLLEGALSVDCNSEYILDALKIVGFWKEKFLNLDKFKPTDYFLKGDYIIQQWVNFSGFFCTIKSLLFDELSGLRFFIFERAIQEFNAINPMLRDADVLRNLGRSFKILGNYEKGLNYLEKSFKKRRDDPGIMAELADSYSLSNKEKMAKVFFRESFFIDPKKIELTFIDSPIIGKMIEKISEKEYDKEVLKYWIPVYGAIYGVFNIKRELKPIELGKLKQAIFIMEQQPESKMDSIGKAKLLNHYFWLIDHTKASLHSMEGREPVDEILQKIKRLDRKIYLEYTK